MKKTKLVYLLWVLLAPLFYNCGGSDADELSIFEVSPTSFTLSNEQTSGKFTINTGGGWNITVPEDESWCKLSATSGEGDAEITVTADQNTTGAERKAVLAVVGDGKTVNVTVTQVVSNIPPTAPQLTEPAADATEVAVLPVFKWVISVDAENDPITYVVSWSIDQKNWTSSDPVEKNEFGCKKVLKNATTYYWKVTAQDSRGGKTESAVGTFKTGDVGAYQDGELFQYMKHTKGKRGVRLVFTGDGFIPQDHIKGGEFDKAVKEACEALFDVEPYKTYKEYFDVYQVAAYSEERGISDERTGSSTVKKTCFGVRLSDQGASMLIGSGNSGEAKVFSWIQLAMNLKEYDMPETIITVIGNEDAYGGCCYMSSKDFTTVAAYARSTKTLDPSGTLHGHYKNILMHELGHAIGLLAEEYVNEDGAITSAELTSVRAYQKAGYYQNISLSNKPEDLPWKEFIGVQGYQAVGCFEGAGMFGKGVWRSENQSCMTNNELRYSAPARRAIVNRIMKLAGEDVLTFEEFVANDHDKQSILPPEEN